VGDGVVVGDAGGGCDGCTDECLRGVSILSRILLRGSIIELSVLFTNDSVSKRPVFSARNIFYLYLFLLE